MESLVEQILQGGLQGKIARIFWPTFPNGLLGVLLSSAHSHCMGGSGFGKIVCPSFEDTGKKSCFKKLNLGLFFAQETKNF